MKNKIGILGAYAMMAAIDSTTRKNDNPVVVVDDDADKLSSTLPAEKLKGDKVIPPVKKVCPAGAKQYFFNAVGEFSTVKMKREECVFTCFAINDNNAIKKFKKHIQSK